MMPQLKPPYLQKMDSRGELDIWLVDGSYVRTNIDPEFTNFGQHYRYDYIPPNELWIDREASADEQQFFIDHLLVEHELMSKGATYAKALMQADRVERRERRRAGDVKRLTQKGKVLPGGDDVHTKLWKTLESGLEVWVVSGRLVRSVFDIDFTAGGHEHVYEFVPEGEVWIDDDIIEEERPYVLLHELHERNRMAKGIPYSKAHEGSSKLEYHCRRHPDELHEALAKEGWA